MTSMWQRRSRKAGFTLVELIVSLAILTLVLGFVFGFFLHNLNLFSTGDNLSDVQSDVRLASDWMTTELRNVTAVSLDTTQTDSIDLAALQARYPRVSGVSFEAEAIGTQIVVHYTLQGQDAQGENPYSITSSVVLNNVGSVTGTAVTGSVIYYEKTA